VSFDAPVSSENDMTLADIIPAEVESPDDITVNQEFVNRIGQGMEKLSTKHREILVLRNIKNLSYEEIAAILGISVGTVKSRIARARESLRSKLGEDFKN
jgi:RNA polymerase sigma-70 factor (ECF subfamily)